MKSEEEISHEKEWLQHHYDMWNEIVNALKKNNKVDIYPIKEKYVREHTPDAHVCCNCYLCDMYICSECPLAAITHQPCNTDDTSIFSIVADTNSFYSRVDAAKTIRDCVIDWRN